MNNLQKKMICQKIRHLRETLKLTQKEFAEKADISRSIISQIEINKFMPKLDNIKKISRIYNIPYAYFFEENVELDLRNGSLSIFQQENSVCFDLKKENERLNEKLNLCEERVKNKIERIDILEEKLELYTIKKKDVG